MVVSLVWWFEVGGWVLASIVGDAVCLVLMGVKLEVGSSLIKVVVVFSAFVVIEMFVWWRS